jgi:hypothetical protein
MDKSLTDCLLQISERFPVDISEIWEDGGLLIEDQKPVTKAPRSDIS